MSKALPSTRPKRWDPTPPPPRLTCERVIYEDGAARICGAPSKGRTYCQSCHERSLKTPAGTRYGSVRKNLTA